MIDFEFAAKKMVVDYFNECIGRKGWKDIDISQVEVLEPVQTLNGYVKYTMLRTIAHEKRVRYRVYYNTKTRELVLKEHSQVGSRRKGRNNADSVSNGRSLS